MTASPGRGRGWTWLVALGALFGCGEDMPPTAARHLVLISIDTLRADRLGCYGEPRDTSPRLDAFAAESLLFEDVSAAATNTAPSHMSMFTGVHAPVHGTFNMDLAELEDGTTTRAASLPRGLPTLAERLSDAGWRTVAFTDGGYLTSDFQFDRGFDEFDARTERVDRKVDRALEWLRDADPEAPSFLFFHTYEVHAPYVPPVEHDRFTDPDYDGELVDRVAALRTADDLGGVQHARGFLPPFDKSDAAERAYLSDLYDGSVHFVDAEIGRLLDALRSPPWAGQVAVIVTSDHGEAFGEHGRLGHNQLYQPVAAVPLLIAAPGLAAGRVATPVSGLDITPTALDLLGQPVPPGLHGRSLLAALDDERLLVTWHNDPARGHGFGLRRGAHKLLRHRQAQPWQHFDVLADPDESDELPAEDPTARDVLDEAWALETELSELARRLREAEPAVGDEELSEETLESLRELGYLR